METPSIRKLTKYNVLTNVGDAWKPFGQICVEMASTLQRTISVNEVKRLLVTLAREGQVETQQRDGRLLYRKS